MIHIIRVRADEHSFLNGRKTNRMKAIATVLVLILTVPPVDYADDSGAPRGRLSEAIAPQHYRITLDIDPRHESFSGRADIDVTVAAPTSALWLDGLGLKVEEVTVEAGGGKVAGDYEEVDHESGVARIVLSKPLPAGPATLHLRYRATFQTSPQGLYRTQAGKDWYVFSQMEAIDARRVFPGFDEPRFKTPFDITVVTHNGDRAISNTPEVRAVPVEGGDVRHEYVTTKPLPTYLIAFAVGPLDVAEAGPIPPNAVRHEPLPFRIIGTRGQAATFTFALKETPDIVRRLEEYFGIPFPYPKLDLIASPIHLGAMENAGAIIFADSYLALGPAPTPRQQSNFGDVSAHELAHQWFGDLVTPAWWDDIWLNESFAEWMGSKISDQWRPGLGIQKEQLQSTLKAMDTDALRSGRPIHQLVTDNNQIGATFDSITYDKGAGVIAMVESYLGVERFQRGVRLHLQRHAYGTATASEFFAAMAEASGEPIIVDAFRSFVDQPGLPLVAVSAGSDGRLLLEQTRYRPLGPGAAGTEQWYIPLCARIYTDLESKACTLLSGPRGTLTLPAAERGAIVHPNANGAGYYRFAVDPTLLHSLLTIAPKMSAREAIVLADSVAAAFEAGRLSFAEFYTAAKVLAQHPDRTAALSLGYKLDGYGARLASPNERRLVERAIVSLYKSRLDSLGYDVTPGRYAAEPAEQQLLRRQLIGLVGLSGRDPQVRHALAGAAATSVADPTRIEPFLRWCVWPIGVQEQGAPLVGPLKALVLESRDPAIRRDAALALGNAEGTDVASNVREFALDPKVDVESAVRGIMFTQVNNPRTREAAWNWFTAHQDAVINRIPAMFQSVVARFGAGFCTSTERQAFDRQVGARIRGVNGGEIAVDRALERIDNCSALRERTGSSIHTTLAAELVGR